MRAFSFACMTSSAFCHPTRCWRSGVTQPRQCGQRIKMRLFVPALISRFVRPSSVESVHSAYNVAISPNARSRPSNCSNLSASREVVPTTSKPSASVTTSTRAVLPARCLSPPPPTMNRRDAPLANWMPVGVPPFEPRPVDGRNSRNRLDSIAGLMSSFHLSPAMFKSGMP